jgi:cytochrome c-type biogenesis protein CcmH/NrfG
MTAERKRVHAAIAVAVVAVGVTAAGLYAQLSRRAAFDSSSAAVAVAVPSSAPGAPPGAASRPAAPTIEDSAERLERRLKEKGGSAEDWALLARSYVQRRRYPDAVNAFARALEKMPGNAAFLAEQSVARKAASDGAVAR